MVGEARHQGGIDTLDVSIPATEDGFAGVTMLVLVMLPCQPQQIKHELLHQTVRHHIYTLSWPNQFPASKHAVSLDAGHDPGKALAPASQSVVPRQPACMPSHSECGCDITLS